MTVVISSLIHALLCLLIVSFVIADDSEPIPYAYPNEFSIQFVCNITKGANVNPEFPVEGTMYYNWNIESQRIDHGAGAYECTEFYNHSGPCTLYFNPKGLFRYLHGNLTNSQLRCCLDMEDIGASPPDWADNAGYNYEGIVVDDYSNQQAYQFSYAEGAHLSRDLIDTKNAMLLFTFEKEETGGLQDFHYDATTMKVGSQNDQLFEIPPTCYESCTTSTSLYQKHRYIFHLLKNRGNGNVDTLTDQKYN